MMKLKHQYFGHLMQRADSLEKTLMLGKIEGRRRSGQQRMNPGEHVREKQIRESFPERLVSELTLKAAVLEVCSWEKPRPSTSAACVCC